MTAIRLTLEVLLQLACSTVWLAAVLTAILSTLWVFS